MAAPTVLSRATSVSSTTSAEAWSPTLPTITAGKSLLVWLSADGDDLTATESPGWVKLGQRSNSTVVTGAWYWKPRALGGAADTLNLYNETTEQYSAIAWCIDAGDNPQIAWAFSDGSSTNSDPPNLSLGASQDALWIATRAGDSTVVATAAPTNFSNLQTQAGGGTSGASSNSAERSFTGSSLDPGTFTSGSEQWVCSTLAIWAAPAGLPYILQYAQSDTPDVKRSSATVELAAPATAGNWLVVWVLPDKNPSTITPPSGFSAAGSPHTGGSDISGGVYVKEAAGGEQSFTGSWNTSPDERGVLVAVEIAGASGIDQYAKGGSTTVEARSASAGPVTPTTTMQLALAMFANDSAWNAGEGTDHTWADGFMPFAAYLPTGELNPTGDPGWSLGVRALPEIGDVEPAYSYTGGTADQTLMLLVTFKPATSGGGSIEAVASIAEAADSCVASGRLGIAAGASFGEAPDTVTAAARIGIAASAGLSDASDGLSSAGRLALKAQASLTEAPDVLAGVGRQSATTAFAALIEASDGITATARLALRGAGAGQEAFDALVAAAGVRITAAGEIQEASDFAAAAGVISAALTASATLVEAADSLSAAAQLRLAAAGQPQEASDGLAAAGVLSIRASASLVEAEDVVAALVAPPRTASAILFEDGDTLAAVARYDRGWTPAFPNAAVWTSDTSRAGDWEPEPPSGGGWAAAAAWAPSPDDEGDWSPIPTETEEVWQ